MRFDHSKILESASERSKLDATLDDYLALRGDALSRMRFKRRGPARQSMIEALAQMAMLFAAANMGSIQEFDACLCGMLGGVALDEPEARGLRAFYLRNAERVPGTAGGSIERLARASARILDAPMLASPSLS